MSARLPLHRGISPEYRDLPHSNQSAKAKEIRARFHPDEMCHSGRDGDCFWEHCPQATDYQGFCCPLLHKWEDE